METGKRVSGLLYLLLGLYCLTLQRVLNTFASSTFIQTASAVLKKWLWTPHCGIQKCCCSLLLLLWWGSFLTTLKVKIFSNFLGTGYYSKLHVIYQWHIICQNYILFAKVTLLFIKVTCHLLKWHVICCSDMSFIEVICYLLKKYIICQNDMLCAKVICYLSK